MDSDEKQFETLFRKTDRLPTLPGIAMRILETVNNKNADVKKLADIISTDPPLSAEVLKTVNSPLYALPGKTTSVPHAVSLLGMEAVKNLALGFSLINGYQAGPGQFDYPSFWKDSLIAAVTSRLLAQKIIPELAEDAFFLGLLHNIGTLALCQCMPEQYNLVTNEMQKTGCRQHEAEEQILGFTHAQAGAHLVKSWGIPDYFEIPIRHHHYPEKLIETLPTVETLTRILYLAGHFIDLFNRPDKKFQLGLIDFLMDRYRFKPLLAVEDIIRQIQAQTASIFPVFDFKLASPDNYVAMVEKARQSLIQLSSNFMRKLLNQKKQIEKLRKQARLDGMTGLMNYQRFQESIENELYRSARYHLSLSLILSDIDYFKTINDRYGHLAGDYALKTLADCLRRCLRKSDLIARYGGEEFAFILPETSSAEARQTAERMRKQVASLELAYEGHPFNLTMSFGVAAITPRNQISNNDFITMADQALYRAKHLGRNRCCVYEPDSSRH